MEFGLLVVSNVKLYINRIKTNSSQSQVTLLAYRVFWSGLEMFMLFFQIRLPDINVIMV